MNGRGCRKCSGTEQCGTSEWVEKARAIHGDRYDYSQVAYANARTKVIIICPEHGAFEQIPRGHLSGKGCKQCGRKKAAESTKLDQTLIIEGFRKVHGDYYDYSRVNYVHNRTPITIICPKHGAFKQLYADHMNGCGCRKCADENRKNYSQVCLDWLNIIAKYKNIDIQHALNGGEETINLEDSSLTSNRYKRYVTVDGVHHDSLSLFEFHGCYWHGCPECFDADSENTVIKKKMSELYDKTQEKHRLLENTGFMQVISIWECQFRRLIAAGTNPKQNAQLKEYLDSLDFS